MSEGQARQLAEAQEALGQARARAKELEGKLAASQDELQQARREVRRDNGWWRVAAARTGGARTGQRALLPPAMATHAALTLSAPPSFPLFPLGH